MTIIDDLKAINKDIEKAENFERKTKRAKYWIVKLSNIYPDYKFKTYFRPLYKSHGHLFIDYTLKEVY